ncbi:MAG: accessory gene regulator B family protein [Firmicutes bacterium]|nr:accessory gene regulator B family protein [Bacillota bacterium]
MIDLLTKNSVEILIKNGIIEESEKEVYRFGISGLYRFLMNIISSIIIGILFGMLWQTILFSATYIPLRRFAGGYHAKTPGRCYFLSCLLVVCVLGLLKHATFSVTAVLILTVVASVIVFIKAPVASENKPLLDQEKVWYGEKARRILLLEGIVAMALTFYSVKVASCLAVAIGCCSIMVILPMLIPHRTEIKN